MVLKRATNIIMRKLLLTFFIAIFLPSSIYGQNVPIKGFLKGKITDAKTKEGLGGVNIYANEEGVAVSDTGGHYKIHISAGEYIMKFKFIGYSTAVHKVIIRENEITTLNLSLVAEATELGIVVISAGKFEQKIEEITVSMDVIKPALIENKNPTNVEDLMQQCPGVNILEGQANIRGGSGFSYGAGTRVLVLVDDLPILTADATDVKWGFMPIENIEQVEIIKGASSALFGSSALNGVINFRTSYPRDSARTNVNFSSGFYDKPKRKELVWWDNANPFFSNASILHSRQIKNLGVVLGGSGFSDEGYRKLEKEQRVRFNCGTLYKFEKIKGLSAGINANYMGAKGGLFILWQNGDSAYYPQGGSVTNYNNIRATIDPFIIYYTPKQNKHSLRSRYYLAVNKNNTNQESISKVWHKEYQYHMRFEKNLNIINGITGNYSEVTSDSMYGNHFGTNIGIFSQLDKKFDRLILSLGTRGEYFKMDTAQTKYKINFGKRTVTSPIYPVLRTGINYRIFSHTHLRTSLGQGYRFPSVAEKYISTKVNGLILYPNPYLKPETGWSAEFGLKQGFKIAEMSGYFDLAVFWQEYKNMMEFTFGYWDVPPGTPIWFYPKYFGAKSINVGKSQIKGAEITIITEGKVYNVTLSILGGYTYIIPIDLDYDSAQSKGTYDGNILKYRYEHTSKADIQAEYKKFSAGISMRYNSFMKNIDASFQTELFSDIFPTLNSGIYILPGLKEYREKHNTGDIVFDGRISYKFSSTVKTALIVNNIFNREYMGRPGDVQPPRSYSFALSVKI